MLSVHLEIAELSPALLRSLALGDLLVVLVAWQIRTALLGAESDLEM